MWSWAGPQSRGAGSASLAPHRRVPATTRSPVGQHLQANALRADELSGSMSIMVSPLPPGHPRVGMPPVSSPRHGAAPTATAMLASWPSLSAAHPGPRERYAAGGGPQGSSSPSCGSGAWCWRRLLPSPSCCQRILDAPIRRMPDAPSLHGALAVRTAPGGAPRALLVARAGGHRGDACARTLDRDLGLWPRPRAAGAGAWPMAWWRAPRQSGSGESFWATHAAAGTRSTCRPPPLPARPARFWGPEPARAPCAHQSDPCAGASAGDAPPTGLHRWPHAETVRGPRLWAHGAHTPHERA
jgi:hypothetical protein